MAGSLGCQGRRGRSSEVDGGTVGIEGAVELAGRTATELARMVRARTVSAREVVAAHLERIERANPALNAIVTLRAEGALEQAARLDRRLAGGNGAPGDGPERGGGELGLAGVPFTVKDLIATAGVRTTAGTRFLGEFVPKLDATAVARLRAAGAILIGKTNCPEWGMFPYTRNARFGETINPVAPALRRLSPGGSSGGEAAAVASGCSPLGLGTDFGGSLRWPAHCTGVLALRPTAGRIAGTGQLPAPTLQEPFVPNEMTLQGRVQVVGPLARSVEDLELALRTVAGPDGLDPFAVPAELRPSTGALPATVVVWEGPTWPAPRDDVIQVVRDAGSALEGRGVGLGGEAPDFLERAGSLYADIRELDRLQDVRRLVRGREDEVGEDVRAAIAAAEEAERRPRTGDPAVKWQERDRLRAELLAYLERFPIMLMAVATVPAYALDGPAPSVGGREQSMWDVLVPSRLISLFGIPAASVPFGVSTDGLPVGVQVVGRPFREDEVLAVARALMEERAPAPRMTWEVGG
jgi:Asp-tRNA(Asn)/Glu-tRNA(Gln) amidotransferase A subunit family amidase